jgi:hypothetical protein
MWGFLISHGVLLRHALRRIKINKNRYGVVDMWQKEYPMFLLWCFYPTRCVFSIPLSGLGERKHTSRWIRTISHHKPWEILYVFSIILRTHLHMHVPNFLNFENLELRLFCHIMQISLTVQLKISMNNSRQILP